MKTFFRAVTLLPAMAATVLLLLSFCLSAEKQQTFGQWLAEPFKLEPGDLPGH